MSRLAAQSRKGIGEFEAIPHFARLSADIVHDAVRVRPIFKPLDGSVRDTRMQLARVPIRPAAAEHSVVTVFHTRNLEEVVRVRSRNARIHVDKHFSWMRASPNVIPIHNGGNIFIIDGHRHAHVDCAFVRRNLEFITVRRRLGCIRKRSTLIRQLRVSFGFRSVAAFWIERKADTRRLWCHTAQAVRNIHVVPHNARLSRRIVRDPVRVRPVFESLDRSVRNIRMQFFERSPLPLEHSVVTVRHRGNFEYLSTERGVASVKIDEYFVTAGIAIDIIPIYNGRNLGRINLIRQADVDAVVRRDDTDFVVARYRIAVPGVCKHRVFVAKRRPHGGIGLVRSRNGSAYAHGLFG